MVTGPAALARTIEAHAVLDKKYSFDEVIALAGGLLTKLTRAYGEIKIDGLIIREDLLACPLTDGAHRHDLVFIRYAELLPRFIVVEPAHAMDDEAAGGTLEGQVLPGGPAIESVRP